MGGTLGFFVAVAGVSAICYWLMTRVENRAARRSSEGAGSDYSYDSGSSIGGWSLTNWYLSSNSSSSDRSGTSSASGSWDSGGGGSDGGGGGGDGGGGGGD
jgi:hypothetical protein